MFQFFTDIDCFCAVPSEGKLGDENQQKVLTCSHIFVSFNQFNIISWKKTIGPVRTNSLPPTLKKKNVEKKNVHKNEVRTAKFAYPHQFDQYWL